MKKTVSLAMIIVLLCGMTVWPVSATDTLDGETIILEADVHNQIEDLFEMRAGLELDYEANEEAIIQIDKELELLGVEEITYSELSEIAETSAEPRITPTPQQYVKFLSETVCNLYWNYRKYGNTNFNVNYRITKLTFDWIGGEKTVFNIPYNGLSWTE